MNNDNTAPQRNDTAAQEIIGRLIERNGKAAVTDEKSRDIMSRLLERASRDRNAGGVGLS